MQSLLFAAGLRPTPAQATAVSWVSCTGETIDRFFVLVALLFSSSLNFVDEQILKDGMQHAGKLICSNLGARMDSEPKRWRILGLFSWVKNLSFSFCIYGLFSLHECG